MRSSSNRTDDLASTVTADRQADGPSRQIMPDLDLRAVMKQQCRQQGADNHLSQAVTNLTVSVL